MKDELDRAWAVQPLELVREAGGTALVLEDPGGTPLEQLLGAPMDLDRFLRLAIGIAGGLGKVHQCGLVHKDVKPAHILVNCNDGQIRLMGFGIASRLPRERHAPEPPEFIAGTVAYMAPEQTGRTNRSVDARSDLYALGVTFYQMLTGRLPFAASDSVEWVHAHIARRPVPPNDKRHDIPATVSAIVMKLLAKTAEERYQTATGLERDLQRCLADWEERRRIDDFPLAQHDTPDRLLIPEKLYGRASEVETLLAAFDRVAAVGELELLLVSGYPGIGKSAVVDELQKALVGRSGLFASGKCDQYKRDIPYSTLVQSFQSLVRSLLSRSDAELASRRLALLAALDSNAGLVVDLVPELKLIIGEPPPVPELPVQEANARFKLAFRRLLGVFAKPENPLVLFLDDLQWLDAATLDLLEDLSTRADLRHLLLIGAYRDNEVDANHPVVRKLETIRNAGAKISRIALRPLSTEHLALLIADALRCEPESVEPLAELVRQKTGGNPFFATQFIATLAEEGLLAFDHGQTCWRWDLDRIHGKGYADNVVDLMIAKLSRLPVVTQTALQHLACFGSIAGAAMLPMVMQSSREKAEAGLWPAIRLGLVERLADAYRFAHDRVQEAAYSLIPDESRAEIHLLIGRLLLAQTPPERLQESIFEIVNQLDRGVELIVSQQEREQLAELNLIAGKRALASTAFTSALRYLAAGAALLSEETWQYRHELIFALELHRAECEFVTGALAEAEQRLMALSIRATGTVHRAAVACLRADLYTTLGQNAGAVAVGLDYLKHLGVDWSPHPTEEEARNEYERICSQLAGRTIEDLIQLPLMSDPASLATIDVLMKIGTPAFFTEPNLWSLAICRTLNLSLDRGNSDGSCLAYVGLGLIACNRYGDYAAAFRFGEIGYQLVERLGLTRFQARIYLHFGAHLLPCGRHVRAGLDLLHRAFEIANKNGDLVFATYSRVTLIGNLLAAGEPLVDVQREAEHGLEFATKVRFASAIDWIAPQRGLIRTLIGSAPRFGRLDDDQFDEGRMERRFSSSPERAPPEGRYWIRKLQARFFAGDYVTAVEASQKTCSLLRTFPSPIEKADYHFYSALSEAAFCETGASYRELSRLESLSAHYEQLRILATNCPENFESRAALTGAEIARVEGRTLDAEYLYEQAIRFARENGFVQNEGIANELAARFYASRGLERIARAYLHDARNNYLRWGADGKVRQLDGVYPQFMIEGPALGPTNTIGAPVEQLDLATVIKVSQAISGEIVQEKMLDKLMRTAIEHAGAERGVLVLTSGTEQRIAAEATTRDGELVVRLDDEPVTAEVLPETILQYVLRTRDCVALDHAAVQPPFSADPYLLQREARSVLCLPLITHAKLVGALYLENNLAAQVFTPTCISVLRLLASQAAIAIENARLYHDVAQREAKIRRLVDANIVGICIFAATGRIIEANDAFLQIVGYDRDDLVLGRVDWTVLTPPEWRECDLQAAKEMRISGTAQPYEKEYFCKDGSRVPVLIGVASLEDRQGVAFVLNLTERKRAEQGLRQVQTELAHANRVATMGQLTAAIAHEVKQPIAATVTNAQAALHFLCARDVDLSELRNILIDIVKDGNRAGEIINRIRDLIRKAPPRRECLDINEAIRDVVELTRSEAAKNCVSVRAELADGLPLIRGDRVELQQVVLNLVVNALEAIANVAEGPRELLISTAATQPGLLVSVRDSGPRLPASALDQLFAGFYTTKPSGLGLGLSICRSIIEAHGGRVSASANVPRGAVFQFTLPAVED